MPSYYRWFSLVVILIAACGCRSSDSNQAAQGETPMAIQLSSKAFTNGGTIPVKYTCDGENVSPDLSWSGTPQGVKSLALIADDPDAPAGTWVHWVLYDLPPDTTSLAEGTQGVGVLGTTSFGDARYGGPCPPRGKPHRYFFKLYALDKLLGLSPGATKAAVEKAMQGHILGSGQLMGTYGR
jgi:Raf kinase inhibitor-like YbhB/YbcL family protein